MQVVSLADLGHMICEEQHKTVQRNESGMEGTNIYRYIYAPVCTYVYILISYIYIFVARNVQHKQSRRAW